MSSFNFDTKNIQLGRRSVLVTEELLPRKPWDRSSKRMGLQKVYSELVASPKCAVGIFNEGMNPRVFRWIPRRSILPLDVKSGGNATGSHFWTPEVSISLAVSWENSAWRQGSEGSTHGVVFAFQIFGRSEHYFRSILGSLQKNLNRFMVWSLGSDM